MATSRIRETGADDHNPTDHNHVVLRGRVAAEPVSMELPSGDPMVTVRLVVRRPDGPARRGLQVVDTLDCSAWRPGVRRSVLGWVAGDVVEVTGSVRRRFWRGPSGPQSRWEVEIASARRLNRRQSPSRSGAERA